MSDAGHPPNSSPDPPVELRVEPDAVPPAPPAAPKRPRPGLGEAILWCVLFRVTLFVGAVLGVAFILGVHALRSEKPGDFLRDQFSGLGKAAATPAPPEGRPPIPAEIGQSLAWGMLAAQVASLALILVVLPQRVGPDWKRQLGFRRPWWFHVLLVVLLLPGFMLLVDGIQEILLRITTIRMPVTPGVLNQVFVPWPRWLTVLTVGVGPGMVEELWCRGFLGRGLCARYGLTAGVILTSVLFGLLHVDPMYAIVTGCMGAYLHFVYLASRSIWVPILLHALNNGLAMLAILSGLVIQMNPTVNELARVIYLTSFSLVLFASVALWTSRTQVLSAGVREVTWQPEYPGVSHPPPGSDAQLGRMPPSPVAVVLTFASFAVLVYLLSK
jgi:membrane protease YdiL (CAAX protease family)